MPQFKRANSPPPVHDLFAADHESNIHIKHDLCNTSGSPNRSGECTDKNVLRRAVDSGKADVLVSVQRRGWTSADGPGVRVHRNLRKAAVEHSDMYSVERSANRC